MSYQFNCPTGVPCGHGSPPSNPTGSPRKLMDSGMLKELRWVAKVGLEQGLARAYKDFSELCITASNLRT